MITEQMKVYCFTTGHCVKGQLRDGELHFQRLCHALSLLPSPALALNSLKIKWSKLSLPLLDGPVRIDLLINSEGVELVSGQRGESKTPAIFHSEELKAEKFPPNLKSPLLLLREPNRLYFDQTGVLELSFANIFMVHGNSISTPELRDGVLNGITRQKAIHSLDSDWIVKQRVIGLDELMNADFCFGTNSLKGAFFIKQIDKTKFNFTEAWNMIHLKLINSGVNYE